MKNALRSICLLVCLVGVSAQADVAIDSDVADPKLYAAYTLIKGGKARAAEPILIELAERGEPRAQAALGLLYARGDGVEQDLIAGFAWLTVAARSGHREWSDAANRLEEAFSGRTLVQARRAGRRFLREYPTDSDIVCAELVVPAADLPEQCREPDDARNSRFTHSVRNTRQLSPSGPGFRPR
ncbi:MAG: hypothetical protein AAGE01_25585 [Pseudomonadota bacterium]